jgi:hypothetical protein
MRRARGQCRVVATISPARHIRKPELKQPAPVLMDENGKFESSSTFKTIYEDLWRARTTASNSAFHQASENQSRTCGKLIRCHLPEKAWV